MNFMQLLYVCRMCCVTSYFGDSCESTIQRQRVLCECGVMPGNCYTLEYGQFGLTGG